jgi:GMP synthase-like glutamine amidotransferase
LKVVTNEYSGWRKSVKLLVFQHIECEHPGIFRALLDEAEIQWDAVELDAGERIPDFGAYDALWVMGGPMDVWEEDECPWLVPEKAAIRHWVCDLKKTLSWILSCSPVAGRCTGWCLFPTS